MVGAMVGMLIRSGNADYRIREELAGSDVVFVFLIARDMVS